VAACILDAILPRFDFDYLDHGRGRDDAIRFLKTIIDKHDYRYVVTADIKDCFWSASKKEVTSLLPLPAKVTRHREFMEYEEGCEESLKRLHDLFAGKARASPLFMARQRRRSSQDQSGNE
jgi:hypothetical protein